MSAIAPFTPNPERAKRKREIVIDDYHFTQLHVHSFYNLFDSLTTVVHVGHRFDKEDGSTLNVGRCREVRAAAGLQRPPKSSAQFINDPKPDIVSCVLVLRSRIPQADNKKGDHRPGRCALLLLLFLGSRFRFCLCRCWCL